MSYHLPEQSPIQKSVNNSTPVPSRFSQKALQFDAQPDNMRSQIKESVLVGDDAIGPPYLFIPAFNFPREIIVQRDFLNTCLDWGLAQKTCWWIGKGITFAGELMRMTLGRWRSFMTDIRLTHLRMRIIKLSSSRWRNSQILEGGFFIDSYFLLGRWWIDYGGSLLISTAWQGNYWELRFSYGYGDWLSLGAFRVVKPGTCPPCK